MISVGQRFTGLGSTIEGVVLVPDEGTGQTLWRTIRRLTSSFEQRFSRFDRRSELSTINADAGRSVTVSPEMMAVLQQAKRMFELTRGRFDPMIGSALIAAGYNRSFGNDTPVVTAPPSRAATFASVKLDPARQMITLPSNAQIDLGGIGKGYLADFLADEVRRQTDHFWLSLGGDIRVSGVQADGQPWSIAVEDQFDPQRDWATLRVPAGSWGIATSGINRRHGVHHGKPWHHLIDPTTQAPSTSDVFGATVIAPTTLEADVFAKTVVLMGSTEGMQWLRQQPQTFGLCITKNRDSLMTPGLEEYLQIL